MCQGVMGRDRDNRIRECFVLFFECVCVVACESLGTPYNFNKIRAIIQNVKIYIYIF